MTHAQTKTALLDALDFFEFACASGESDKFTPGYLLGTARTLYAARAIGEPDVELLGAMASALEWKALNEKIGRGHASTQSEL